ncbi:MAG: hypothetical protein L0G70_10505, partial [Rubrobacter sp.]|nr:hypothetical protein [Rubrobacter sp.]
MQQYITAQNVSTTDQELLELYEQRYKPEMLAAAEAKAEADASTNYSYLLQAEGLSVIEADTDAAFSEGGERPLYLGTPAGAGDAEGIDLAGSSGSHAEGIGEADEDPESCPVPSAADRELVDTLRERGHAATPSEIAHHAGANMDVLGAATLAHYRHHAGHVLLATSAAADEDLDRAAHRATAEAIGHAFERSVGHASAVASRLIQRLTDIGGSGSLDEVRRHLAALGCDRRAIRPVIGELHRRGLVRISVRGAAPAKEQRDQRQRPYNLPARHHPADATARVAVAGELGPAPHQQGEQRRGAALGGEQDPPRPGRGRHVRGEHHQHREPAC